MKLCAIYNSAAHYRREIFLKSEQEFGCRFAFGKMPVGANDIRSIEPEAFQQRPTYLKNKRIFGNWYWQKGVLTFLKKDFDTYLILGEPFCVSTWVFCGLAKIFKKRIFFWSHGWYGRETFIRQILKKVFFRLGDGIFLYGNYARELMIKEGFNPEILFVIHNSLAYSEQLRLRSEVKIKPIFSEHFQNESQVLIFVGRLTKSKRLDMILDAMNTLQKEGLSLNLVLVGDGSDREYLEAHTQNLGLGNNVWFYGACYDEAGLAELIFNADLCVSPGNIGLTAIHALMFGCPCITHNDFPYQGPEFEAIKPDVTGAFFERGSTTSLAKAISAWFSVSRSRQEIRRACYAEIDTSWNPDFQINVLKNGFNKKQKDFGSKECK